MTPTDHELNKLLADVAGVPIKEHWEDGPDGEREGWVYLKQRDARHEIWPWWEPLHDHNQMALVEEGLKKERYRFSVSWDMTCYMSYLESEEGVVIRRPAPTKLYALALAIWGLYQQKETL